MKNILLATTLFLAAVSFQAQADQPAKMKPTPVTQVANTGNGSGEEWKGEPGSAEFDAGGLVGLGIIDSQAGFAAMVTGAKKIVHHGFIPDINNSVWLEAQLGPLFTQGSAVFAYSFHLRWDFQKDHDWTFYALGGLGGDITSSSLGSRFILLPRFGVGAVYHLNDVIGIRAEVSHELIAAGVVFPFL